MAETLDYQTHSKQYLAYLSSEVGKLIKERESFDESCSATPTDPAVFRTLHVFDEKIRILEAAASKFRSLFPESRTQEGQLAQKAQ